MVRSSVKGYGFRLRIIFYHQVTDFIRFSSVGNECIIISHAELETFGNTDAVINNSEYKSWKQTF